MALSWKDSGTVVPAVLLAGGVAYGVTAWGYDLGTSAQPGPGLLPFFIAVAVVLSAAAWLITTARHRPTDHELFLPLVPASAQEDPAVAPLAVEAAGGAEPAAPDETLHWGRIAGVALAAILVFPVSSWVGLVGAAAVLAAVTAALMRTRWFTAVVIGAVFGVLGYLVFEQWLGVPLPDGFLFTQGGIFT
jgi:tripartite tricarboxylate transporter TctB family protein